MRWEFKHQGPFPFYIDFACSLNHCRRPSWHINCNILHCFFFFFNQNVAFRLKTSIYESVFWCLCLFICACGCAWFTFLLVQKSCHYSCLMAQFQSVFPWWHLTSFPFTHRHTVPSVSVYSSNQYNQTSDVEQVH